MQDFIELKAKILVIDDEPNNLQVLKLILQDSYQLIFAKNGVRGIELACEHKPNLILLDVMMPSINGFETCRRLKAIPEVENIPVIFVTAMTDVGDESKGFEVGAVDYITKPVSAPIVKARVKTHLSLVSVNEILQTRIEIIRRLGRAAEYRDNETGKHVIRMSHYSEILARAAGLPADDCEAILHASPMHDIGKIGIPDYVLLKPGPLDDAEWEIMRRHTTFGAEIIGKHNSLLLETARSIAETHHERWDGKGYPLGLKGEEIPMTSRIVTVADVFDALTTKRPYKEEWPIEKAVAYIENKSGSQFDPELGPLFLSLMDEVLEIREQWKE